MDLAALFDSSRSEGLIELTIDLGQLLGVTEGAGILAHVRVRRVPNEQPEEAVLTGTIVLRPRIFEPGPRVGGQYTRGRLVAPALLVVVTTEGTMHLVRPGDVYHNSDPMSDDVGQPNAVSWSVVTIAAEGHDLRPVFRAFCDRAKNAPRDAVEPPRFS